MTDAINDAETVRVKRWVQHWMEKNGVSDLAPELCVEAMLLFQKHLNDHSHLQMSIAMLEAILIDASESYKEDLQVVYDAMLDECDVDVKPLQI